MMDFKEYSREKQHSPYCSRAEAFTLGQQSKQAEIDALKSKLDELTKWAESHIKDYNPRESDSEHDRGWFSAACQVLRKLKGELK